MLHINRFHSLCFVLWQFALFFCCQQIFPIFYNYTPDRDCADSGFHWSKQQCQLSKAEQCKELEHCNVTVLEKAPFHSMVQDFGLFCGSQAYDATLVSTIQFVGVLVGTLIYGHLGDHFGRKPISLIGITIGVAFGVGSGFAPSWEVFAALRFVVGSSIACILVVFYTYIVEMIHPEQRVFLRSFFNWGYARVVFTLVCFLCHYWRSTAVITALLATPIIPIVLFVLPESPKWYEKKKRFADAKQAERQIERIANFMKTSSMIIVNEDCLEKETKINFSAVDKSNTKQWNDTAEQMSTEEDSKIYTMKDLFTERQIARRTVILGVLWFATSLSAFGSDLSSGNLHGHFYVNQFVSGAVTAFAKIFVYILDTYWPSFDRRRLHQYPQFFMIIAYATIMFIIIFVPDENCGKNEWRDWTIIIINIIGVSLIELTWDACYLVAVECFPTQLRTIGMGTCSLMARIGALVAPQMAYLSNLTPSAPYILVVSIGLISLVISILFLPDTKGTDLSTVGQQTEGNENEEMKF